ARAARRELARVHARRLCGEGRTAVRVQPALPRDPRPLDPDPHVAEARRHRAVPDVRDLERLTLVARREAVDAPARPIGDGVARGPEVDRTAAGRAVLQEPAELAVLDLPTALRADAEVPTGSRARPV